MSKGRTIYIIRFWFWVGVSSLIFVLTAMSQTILTRPIEYSWIKVHILFWLTRDIPLMLWGFLWWVIPAWKNEEYLRSRMWIIYNLAISIITFWFVFNAAQQWTMENSYIFWGNPEKPRWIFW